MKQGKINVFVVDDNDTDNFIVQRILSNIPDVGAIEVFTDGNKAADALKQAEAFPHIILLDLNMPEMSGYEFIEWLQDNEIFDDQTIAILSSSVRTTDKLLADNYENIIAFIEKPLSTDKMQKFILSHPRLAQLKV